MATPFEIQNLSREDKLRVMEAIWEDLIKESDKIESPSWHQETLKETEQRLERGEENKIDWNIAKQELRKRFE